jgi:hypothetical protein
VWQDIPPITYEYYIIFNKAASLCGVVNKSQDRSQVQGIPCITVDKCDTIQRACCLIGVLANFSPNRSVVAYGYMTLPNQGISIFPFPNLDLHIMYEPANVVIVWKVWNCTLTLCTANHMLK